VRQALSIFIPLRTVYFGFNTTLMCTNNLNKEGYFMNVSIWSEKELASLDKQEIIAEGHKFRASLLMEIEHGDVEAVNLYT
jgi:hypothetical protein